MADRVSVAPRLIEWARLRSGHTVGDVAKRFPRLPGWEAGTARPTMRQLEEFAHATHTPVGFFFLPQPPEEDLPIPDFRTIGGEALRTPTPDLLDTIYACQQRQDWYRDFAEAHELDPVPLVGSLADLADPVEAAGRMRDVLGFGLARRVDFSNWANATSSGDSRWLTS